MSKMTANEVIRIEFGDGDGDEVEFECNSCGLTISSWDLVTPCHPVTGFAEGAGHGGVDGMSIFCALNEPQEDEDGSMSSYCGWGGPVKEYVPKLICCMCSKDPFEEEK